MAGTIQNDDGNVRRPLALGVRHCANVVLDRGVDVNNAAGLRADRDFLHVKHGGWVVHGSTLCCGEHRDSVLAALSHQCGPINRVDSDVDIGAFACSDLFTVEEHRGFIFLTFADNDHTAHCHGVDHLAHGVDSGSVAFIFLSAADPPARGKGGGFRHADQFHSKVTVRWCLFVVTHGWHMPPVLASVMGLIIFIVSLMRPIAD